MQAAATVPDWGAAISSDIELVNHSLDDASTSAELNSVPFLDLDATDAAVDTSIDANVSNTDLAIRLVTWTLVILCLCVLTVLAIRKWQRNNGMLPESAGQSKVLETVMIGHNRSVSLVQLRGLQAVVGCDGSGIQSIVLAPPDFSDVIDQASAATAAEESSESVSFSSTSLPS